MENKLYWYDEAWSKVVEKIGRTASEIGAAFPNGSIGGRYKLSPSHDWITGFWPGLLWLVYRETGDQELKQFAMDCEMLLRDELYAFERLHHDVGFMYSLSSVAQYKLLGDEEAKRHGLMAASLLAGRFNVKGDFIRAWPDWNGEDHSGWAIIDCVMNLPLLYWASEEIGDPRYRHLAIRHADMVLKHFLRDDSSVSHIVCFDPETGERIGELAGQGYSADSAWARGTAWALYGLALSFRYTGEQRFLDAAKRVAHFFIANLPEDHLPYWDFRLPSLEGMPRDSSAAACAASGLLELASLVPPGERGLYRSAALRMGEALYRDCGAWDREEQGLLLHATGYFAKDVFVDAPLIYGDYFFVEMLAKLRGHTQLFW